MAVMADESLIGPASAFSLARVDGADVFAVKIEQSGGLQAAQHVAAIACAANIQLYGGTMLEGGIGTVASAHTFATFDSLQWGTELFGPLLLTEEILQRPLVYNDFHLSIPDGPGLGVALDWESVHRFSREHRRVVVAAS
jgi:muconate cycloisomerase